MGKLKKIGKLMAKKTKKAVKHKAKQYKRRKKLEREAKLKGRLEGLEERARKQAKERGSGLEQFSKNLENIGNLERMKKRDRDHDEFRLF